MIIETANLTKKFGNLIAVNNLSLRVKQGEIFGLLGPDGAGKTTTMRLLLSLLLPDSGTIRIIGSNLPEETARVKERVGYVPQRFSLYEDLNLEENIDFYADLYGIAREEREKKKQQLLEFTRLAPFTGRLAGRLSGGMKQKLQLMCALIHDPELLILDEPTTGVDPVSRQEFWQILSSLVPRVTVFVSTAYMDEASRCDRVALMYEGRLIRCDTPDQVRNGKSMEGAFLALIEELERSK